MVCHQESEKCELFESCETGDAFLGCMNYFSCNSRHLSNANTRTPQCEFDEIYAERYTACLRAPILSKSINSLILWYFWLTFICIKTNIYSKKNELLTPFSIPNYFPDTQERIGNLESMHTTCVSTSPLTIETSTEKTTDLIPLPPIDLNPETTQISCQDLKSCMGTSCYTFYSRCEDIHVCSGGSMQTIRSCNLFKYCYHRRGHQVIQTNSTYCRQGETFNAFTLKCIPEVQREC